MVPISTSKAADCESVKKSLAKCGGTPFFAGSITVDIDGGLFIPASALNDMRKSAINKLYEIREKPTEYQINGYSIKSRSLPCPQKQEIIGHFETAEQICDGFDKIVLDYNLIYENKALITRYKERLIASLPTVLFSMGATRQKLSALKELGIDTVYAPNLYAIRLGRELGFKVMGGFSLNIVNSVALKRYAEIGIDSAEISFESTLERFDKMAKPIPTGLIIYGKMPLMTMRACPIKTNNGCDGCDGRPMLIDRMGNDMRILCKNKQFVRLLNPQPIYMGDKLPQFKNAHFLSVYFTDESKSECRRILSLIRDGKEFKSKFTRGLYYKEIK